MERFLAFFSNFFNFDNNFFFSKVRFRFHFLLNNFYRRWTYPDMNSTSLTKKCCSLIERSVAPPKSTRFPEQRVNVYKSEFLIVPNESDRNRCQLVYISKSDIRYI